MNYSLMKDAEMQQRLRQEAKALLEQGKADWFIGFEPGSLRFTTTPLITRDKDDVDRLVVGPFIVNNLSNFLTEVKGRVGIVAKGCDSRSIVSLIQDNKVKRGDIFILGVPCSGIIDVSKVESLVARDRDEVDEIVRRDDVVSVGVGGQRKEFPAGQVLFDNCLGCELPTPKEYDLLLGEPVSPIGDRSGSREKLEKLKAISPDERWRFWQREFGRCIRCYACRNVCPACFCKRCFVEESEPQWLLPMPRWQDNLMFQTIRNIHVAGRCTDCGECERVCPANIPLRSLTKDMYDIVVDLFHFKSGMDVAEAPLLTAYEVEEAEDLIR